MATTEALTNITVSREVHAELKRFCVMRNITMKDFTEMALQSLMSRIRKQEDEISGSEEDVSGRVLPLITK